jgi:RNA polymerase sigma factor (sigma-70 family)
MGLAEKRNSGCLYNAHLYRAKPNIISQDARIVAMVEGRDMEVVDCYTDAEIVNKFRYFAREEKQRVKFSSRELGELIQSDRCAETIRKKLHNIAALKYIKPSLVGRMYEYELDFGRLLNTRTPEIINEQGNKLATLFLKHLSFHLQKDMSKATVNRWKQSFKGMLEVYDYKAISHIMAYLPHSERLAGITSPSHIKRHFIELYEAANKKLSNRRARKYLHKLANDLLHKPIPVAEPPAVEEKKPSIYTAEEWKLMLEWTAELDKKHMLDNWFWRLSYNVPGMDIDEFRDLAQDFMFTYIKGATKSNLKRNSWLIYRLRGHIKDKLRAVDKTGRGIILNMGEDKRIEDYKDIIDPYSDPDEDNYFIDERIKAAVKEAVNKLPEIEQAIICDYYGLEGLSLQQNELAERYGISNGWVSRLLTKARAKVEAILADNNDIKTYLERRERRSKSPPT